MAGKGDKNRSNPSKFRAGWEYLEKQEKKNARRMETRTTVRDDNTGQSKQDDHGSDS